MDNLKKIYIDKKQQIYSQQAPYGELAHLDKEVLIGLMKEKDQRIVNLEKLLDLKTQELWKYKLKNPLENGPQDEMRGFMVRLKARFPSLSSNDLRISSLLRQNFSTKEVAHILGIGADSANKARYRIRKKLGLQRSDDLIHFLFEF